MNSAEILRTNILKRLEVLGKTLGALCVDAGFSAKKYYPVLQGEPKSVRLTTLDELALVLHTYPWDLVTPDADMSERDDDEIPFCFYDPSSKVFRDNVNLDALDRKTKWDIVHGRRSTFTLRKLDAIAETIKTTTAELISPQG